MGTTIQKLFWKNFLSFDKKNRLKFLLFILVSNLWDEAKQAYKSLLMLSSSTEKSVSVEQNFFSEFSSASKIQKKKFTFLIGLFYYECQGV